MNSGKVVLGTLAGFALGAITGILFAPEKGSVTRKKILDKGEEYAEDFKLKMNGVLESLENKYASVKDGANELVEAGKDRFSDATRDAKNTAKDYGNKAQSEINRVI